ncbi:MAG TPA: hypothetical protein PKD96_01965, partial [Candidatus Absconditabacterales bacterium]|nr:hypothetical protein [Candidatus Absconditabacterales bacterium]
VSEGGIAFDRDILTGYKISHKNGSIKIIDPQGKQAVNIGYFQCKQDKSSEDCVNLAKNIKAAGSSSIDSSNGKKFYKLAETSDRFVSNNDLRGYYFTPSNEQTLNTINQGIRFIDDQFIQEFYSQQIKSACKNSSIALDTVESVSLSFQGLQLVSEVAGQDSQGTGVDCKLQLSISEEPRFSLLLLTSKKTANSESSEDQTASSSSSNTDQKQTATGTPFKINTGNTLDFTSRREFSISYPSKSIAFESTNIKEDLGIKGLSCYSQTNIVAFKDQDSVNENPQVVVYECTTKLTKNSPELKNFIYHESESGLKFLIKSNNADRDNFAKNIIIK